MTQSITTPAVFPPDHEITFWHLYFIALILATAPLGIDVKPGFRLTGGPLEADLLLIQRNYAPLTSIPLLPGLYSRLTTCNIVEYKGPETPHLEDAISQIISYGARFRMLEDDRRRKAREKPLPAQELTLFLVVPHLARKLQQTILDHGAELKKGEVGIWKVEHSFYPAYIIETKARGEIEQEHLYRLLSPRAMENRKEFAEGLSEKEHLAFLEMLPKIRLQLEAYMYEGIEIPNINKIGLENLYQHVLENLPLKDVLTAHSPQRVMSEFSAEERLKGLAAEERLKGLAAEERLKGLAAEERMAGLSPDEQEKLLKLLLTKKIGTKNLR